MPVAVMSGEVVVSGGDAGHCVTVKIFRIFFIKSDRGSGVVVSQCKLNK